MDPVLILDALGDRRFAILSDGVGPHTVSEIGGEDLGPLIGDLACFYVEPGYVIFAGVERFEAHHVTVDAAVAPVHDGVWMAFPVPFAPGARVTAVWRDAAGRELRRHTTPPLERRDLEPHQEAGWTAYAPG